MSFATFIQLVFDGLAIGLVYVFMAAGFNLILSVTNIFFIAFGMFYALGAFITWALVQVGVPFFAAVVIASLLTAAGGAGVYLLVMRKVNAGQQALTKAATPRIPACPRRRRPGGHHPHQRGRVGRATFLSPAFKNRPWGSRTCLQPRGRCPTRR